jgi:hypothetical protein
LDGNETLKLKNPRLFEPGSFTNEKFSVNDDFSLAKAGIETISGIKKITSFFILFFLLAD